MGYLVLEEPVYLLGTRPFGPALILLCVLIVARQPRKVLSLNINLHVHLPGETLFLNQNGFSCLIYTPTMHISWADSVAKLRTDHNSAQSQYVQTCCDGKLTSYHWMPRIRSSLSSVVFNYYFVAKSF